MSFSETKDLNVIHLSTWNEICGIADYTRDMVNSLTAHKITNSIYPIDRKNQKHMSQTEIGKNFAEFSKKAKTADLVHIQHEFSFFSQTNLKHSIDNFHAILKQLRKIKKPVVVTFHTEIGFFDSDIYSFLRSKQIFRNLQNYILAQHWKNKISRFFRKNTRFYAIVHTKQTRLKLINLGFHTDNIVTLPLGILPRDNVINTDKIIAKKNLNYPKNIILLSIFGFISKNKGHEFAIRALALLPENYHLAIVGGPHPESKDLILDRILKLLLKNPSLKDRVRVTGYVDPKTRDAYHAATDICLAPYHSNMSGSAGIGWALSSGNPIIASRISTFNEINQEANCFLMCLQKSVFELAWQIERLVADPDLQVKLVKNALQYASDNQWKNIALKLVNYYKTLLGSITHCNITLPNAIGYRIAVETNATDPVSEECKKGKAYQEDAVELMLSLVRPGNKILDIGAHIGTFSLAATANGCQALAIEASPLNADLIKCSAGINQFDQLHVVNAAVSDSEGVLEFLVNGPWGCVVNSEDNFSSDAVTIKVQALPICILLNKINWDQIDFVKIDIEGYEVTALSGMSKLLEDANAPPIFYESNSAQLERYDQSPQKLKAFLEKFGYRNYLFDQGLLAPVEAKDFQAYPCVDYLAIKDSSRILDKYMRPALTHDEIIQRILGICAHPFASERAIMAKNLHKTHDWILTDMRVKAALDALKIDQDISVRKEMVWWT